MIGIDLLCSRSARSGTIWELLDPVGLNMLAFR
jgi:hypothetical protein